MRSYRLAQSFKLCTLEACKAYCVQVRLSENTKEQHFKEDHRVRLKISWNRKARAELNLLLDTVSKFANVSHSATVIYENLTKRFELLEALYKKRTTPEAEKNWNTPEQERIAARAATAEKRLAARLASEAARKAALLLLQPGGFVYQIDSQYDVKDIWDSPYTGNPCTEWRVATVSRIHYHKDSGSTWLMVSFNNSHVGHDTCVDVTLDPHRLASLGTHTGRSADSPRVCPKNMKICVSLPDGNCFFRSMALQLYGDAEKHSQVRTNCCNFFTTHLV